MNILIKLKQTENICIKQKKEQIIDFKNDRGKSLSTELEIHCNSY